MWLMKILLITSLFNFIDSYAGPKNFGLQIHKHHIKVSEINLEDPIPYPGPMEEGEMIAKVQVRYTILN